MASPSWIASAKRCRRSMNGATSNDVGSLPCLRPAHHIDSKGLGSGIDLRRIPRKMLATPASHKEEPDAWIVNVSQPGLHSGELHSDQRGSTAMQSRFAHLGSPGHLAVAPGTVAVLGLSPAALGAKRDVWRACQVDRAALPSSASGIPARLPVP